MSVLTDAITGFNAKLTTAIDTIQGVNSTINSRASAVAANAISAKSNADAALVSQATALATRTAIDHRYRGALSADPATRTDGTANVVGDEVFNSTAGLLKRWNGSVWLASDLNTANLAASGGAGLVGFSHASAYPAGTLGAKTKQHVDVKDAPYSAVGDGVADDAAAFTAAAAYCFSNGCALSAEGTFRFASLVDLRRIALNMQNAVMVVDHAGIGVMVGGNASVVVNPAQHIGKITRSAGASATPTVRATGCKGQDITVDFTDYFQVYADTTAAVRDAEYSCAYSNFRLRYCTKLELNTNPANAAGPLTSAAGGSVQWINENRFYLNRTQELIVDGSYNHNHNYFFDGNFENSAVINFIRGTNNKVLRARFETQGSSTSISFGATTFNNTIVSSYDENEYGGLDSGTTPGSSTITDMGLFGNTVRDDFREDFMTETVGYADISQTVVNNQTGFPTASRSPDLQRIYSASAGVVLCESPLLSAISGDYYRFVADQAEVADTVRYRPFLRFFNASLVELTPLAAWVVSNNIATVTGTLLSTSTGIADGYARITSTALSAGVAFIKVGWRTSTSQTANALARRLFIRRSSQARVVDSPLAQGQAEDRILSTAVPTQGFALLGMLVRKSDGTARYINTFSLDTSANGALLAAAASVVVTVGTGITVGDVIGINQDDRTTHWTTVSSVSGTTIGLTIATTAASTSGSRVVLNRWRTETT